MPSDPLAFHITFTTYGTWVHGREEGSVDRSQNGYGTPVIGSNATREFARKQQLRSPEYILDEGRRVIVLKTIREVAAFRGWQVVACHIRTNHAHVVIAGTCQPEKIMGDLKAWCSRRIREAYPGEADRDRWTRHGSTQYLWTEDSVVNAAAYVIDGQGDPMAVYDGRAAMDTAVSVPSEAAVSAPPTPEPANG